MRERGAARPRRGERGARERGCFGNVEDVRESQRREVDGVPWKVVLAVYYLAVFFVACKQSIRCMSPQLSIYSLAVMRGSNWTWS